MATNDEDRQDSLGGILEAVRASERIAGMLSTLQMLANQAEGLADVCPSLKIEAEEIRQLVLAAGEVTQRAVLVLDVKIGPLV